MANTTILKYHFEDHKAAIRIVVFVNLLLFSIFIFDGSHQLINNERALICLVSGVFFLLLKLFYNWTSVHLNVFYASLYFIVFIYEFSILGIPERPADFHRGGLSKGSLFDLLIGLLPYLYIGLRLLMIVPLINIVSSSHRLQRELLQ